MGGNVDVDHVSCPVASGVKPLPSLEDGLREASLTVGSAVSKKKRHNGMNKNHLFIFFFNLGREEGKMGNMEGHSIGENEDTSCEH